MVVGEGKGGGIEKYADLCIYRQNDCLRKKDKEVEYRNTE